MTCLSFKLSQTYDHCASKGCTRVGKYKMYLLGLPVRKQSIHAPASAEEHYCGTCKQGLEADYDRAFYGDWPEEAAA